MIECLHEFDNYIKIQENGLKTAWENIRVAATCHNLREKSGSFEIIRKSGTVRAGDKNSKRIFQGWAILYKETIFSFGTYPFCSYVRACLKTSLELRVISRACNNTEGDGLLSFAIASSTVRSFLKKLFNKTNLADIFLFPSQYFFPLCSLLLLLLSLRFLILFISILL